MHQAGADQAGRIVAGPEDNRCRRQAMPLLPVYWERMWEEPIDKVRARYGIVPCTRAYVEN